MRSSIAVLWSTNRIYSAEQILEKYGPNRAAIIAVATQWEGATTKSLILHSWTDLDFRSPSCQEDPRVLDMAGHSDRRTHALNRPCAIREASHGDEPAGGAEDARGRGGSGVRPPRRPRPEWGDFGRQSPRPGRAHQHLPAPPDRQHQNRRRRHLRS